jgi:hypothetical protein
MCCAGISAAGLEQIRPGKTFPAARLAFDVI